MPVPPGDRRAAGLRAPGRPGLYKHGGASCPGGRRGRCSCLAPFPRNAAESGVVNKHRVQAPLSPAHLPLRERAPRARHALIVLPPSSFAPRPTGDAARPGGGAARPGGGTCWTVAPASPLSPGRRRTAGRGRALASGAAPAERAGGAGARHNNTRGTRHCACARPARRKQLGRAAAPHGPPPPGVGAEGELRRVTRVTRTARGAGPGRARSGPGRGCCACAGDDVRRGTRRAGPCRALAGVPGAGAGTDRERYPSPGQLKAPSASL